MPSDMPGLFSGLLPPVWQASPNVVSQLDELHVDTNLEVRLHLHPKLDLLVAVNKDQLAECGLQTSRTSLVNCWGGPVGCMRAAQEAGQHRPSPMQLRTASVSLPSSEAFPSL